MVCDGMNVGTTSYNQSTPLQHSYELLPQSEKWKIQSLFYSCQNYTVLLASVRSVKTRVFVSPYSDLKLILQVYRKIPSKYSRESLVTSYFTLRTNITFIIFWHQCQVRSVVSAQSASGVQLLFASSKLTSWS